MQLLTVVSIFASLTYASKIGSANLFIRQDVGCDLLPCATDDCDLIACGSPGWGVVSDCACCGGLVGCNIPLGHTCGTQDGEPVCFTGSGGASSAAASSAVASASSSVAVPFASSSSSSPPAASSSSSANGHSGSGPASITANKNGASPQLIGTSGYHTIAGALAFFLGSVYIVLL